MPVKIKKGEAVVSDSIPRGDQQGESSGILDKQKVEVEIVHLFRTKPENLPYIWESFADWVKQWL